jgi:hypothetical protein
MPPNGVLLITLRDVNAVIENGKSVASVLGRWTMPAILGNRSVIDLPAGLKKFRFCLYDAAGRNVFECSAAPGNKIRMPGLPAGVYFGRLTAGAEIKIQKTIIFR